MPNPHRNGEMRRGGEVEDSSPARRSHLHRPRRPAIHLPRECGPPAIPCASTTRSSSRRARAGRPCHARYHRPRSATEPRCRQNPSRTPISEIACETSAPAACSEAHATAALRAATYPCGACAPARYSAPKLRPCDAGRAPDPPRNGEGDHPQDGGGAEALPCSRRPIRRAFGPSVSATRCHLPVPGRICCIPHHIRNTPKRGTSGIGASRLAASARPSTSRVCTGSITPSSHSRAVA